MAKIRQVVRTRQRKTPSGARQCNICGGKGYYYPKQKSKKKR